MSIESVRPSNHLILCHPHLLTPSIFPSIRVFSKESVLRIRWPQFWSFSFSISLSSGYSWLTFLSKSSISRSLMVWKIVFQNSCHSIWTGNCPCSSVLPSALRSPPCQHPVSPDAAPKTPFCCLIHWILLVGFTDTLLAGTCHLSIWDLDIMTIPPTSPVPPVGQANPVHTWSTNRFNNCLQVLFLFHSRLLASKKITEA